MSVNELDFQGESGNTLYVQPKHQGSYLYLIDDQDVVRIRANAAGCPVPTPSVGEKEGIDALRSASSLSFFGEDVGENVKVYHVKWKSGDEYHTGLLASDSPLNWEMR